MVTDSGVHPLLQTNCHHQIVYCSVNLTIRLPTPYGRSIWGYNKAVIEKITITIEQVYWENNQQEAIFNKLLLIYSQTLYEIGYLYVMIGIHLGLTSLYKRK